MKKFINVVNYMFGGMFNIAMAAVVVIAAYYATLWAFNQGQGFLSGGEGTVYSQVIEVEVPEEASTLEIGRILREHGLIGNEYIFFLSSTLNGSSRHFRTGVTFQLNTNMGDEVLMDVLQIMPESDLRITIIEGMTTAQIGEIAANRNFFSTADFNTALEEEVFGHSFLEGIPERANRFEGYLFPDTYNLPQSPTPRDLMVRMLNRFGEIFTPDMWERMEELELTLDEVVILASMVERETRIPSDRPLMASVIFNRLEADRPLEIYSTLTYALNRHRDRLLPSDFHSTSPYNTFNRTGLPLGPIGNPGFLSINAVLNAAQTDYMYFLLVDDDGSHVFAETHEGLTEAQARFETAREEQAAREAAEAEAESEGE
ncbi:MAG: endolytic transglycosylase MltG [Defluviitaleaceae bacterium]|nr:endolytic transglycosylase MltG [Defluviitaleaceae bacterium]